MNNLPYGKMVFLLRLNDKLFTEVAARESVEMGIEEIEKEYCGFGAWRGKASFDGVCHAEHLSGQFRVTFHKSVERNVFGR